MGKLLTQECLEASLGPEGARSREEVRFFQPDLAEALSRSSPAAPYVLFGPLALYLLYRAFAPSLEAGSAAAALTALLLVAGGWLSWTLIEYGLHRFIFHLAPTSDVRRVARFLLHFHHHRTAGARQRLVATPLQAGSLIALLAGLGVLLGSLLGDASIALPLLAGQTLGYLAYEWSHYCAHHRRPQTQLGRYLRRHHLHHHAAESGNFGNYGVSSPLWDWVFRTRLAPRGEDRDEDADSGSS